MHKTNHIISDCRNLYLNITIIPDSNNENNDVFQLFKYNGMNRKLCEYKYTWFHKMSPKVSHVFPQNIFQLASMAYLYLISFILN